MARKGQRKNEWKTLAVRAISALACGFLGAVLFALFFCVVGMVFFPFVTPNIAFLAVVLLGFAIGAVAGWLSAGKELWQD
jgi:hypothetical protein